MSKIKVIIKKPKEDAYEAEIENELEIFQELVGGFIETYPINKDILIICNEEGRIVNPILPYNFTVKTERIVGSVVVVGINEDEFSDVPITLSEWNTLAEKKFYS